MAQALALKRIFRLVFYYSVKRTCPMCEAAFPQTVTDEDFESHVMEHFSFEEQETLRYVPPSTENGHN